MPSARETVINCYPNLIFQNPDRDHDPRCFTQMRIPVHNKQDIENIYLSLAVEQPVTAEQQNLNWAHHQGPSVSVALSASPNPNPTAIIFLHDTNHSLDDATHLELALSLHDQFRTHHQTMLPLVCAAPQRNPSQESRENTQFNFRFVDAEDLRLFLAIHAEKKHEAALSGLRQEIASLQKQMENEQRLFVKRMEEQEKQLRKQFKQQEEKLHQTSQAEKEALHNEFSLKEQEIRGECARAIVRITVGKTSTPSRNPMLFTQRIMPPLPSSPPPAQRRRRQDPLDEVSAPPRKRQSIMPPLPSSQPPIQRTRRRRQDPLDEVSAPPRKRQRIESGQDDMALSLTTKLNEILAEFCRILTEIDPKQPQIYDQCRDSILELFEQVRTLRTRLKEKFDRAALAENPEYINLTCILGIMIAILYELNLHSTIPNEVATVDLAKTELIYNKSYPQKSLLVQLYDYTATHSLLSHNGETFYLTYKDTLYYFGKKNKIIKKFNESVSRPFLPYQLQTELSNFQPNQEIDPVWLDSIQDRVTKELTELYIETAFDRFFVLFAIRQIFEILQMQHEHALEQVPRLIAWLRTQEQQQLTLLLQSCTNSTKATAVADNSEMDTSGEGEGEASLSQHEDWLVDAAATSKAEDNDPEEDDDPAYYPNGYQTAWVS